MCSGGWGSERIALKHVKMLGIGGHFRTGVLPFLPGEHLTACAHPVDCCCLSLFFGLPPANIKHGHSAKVVITEKYMASLGY